MRLSIPSILAILTILSATAFAEPPVVPRGKGDACVEPTDVMRKQHMDFLLHQRDRTVHEGIRTKQHSLVECIDCHVQQNSEGDFIPVDAPEQFCQVCHEYTSVKVDCFECHATTPDTAAGVDSAAIELHRSDRLGVMSFRADLSSQQAVDHGL